MEGKLEKIYYSPEGYWKGITAIRKLAQAAKVSAVALQAGSLADLPRRAEANSSPEI